MKNFAVIGNPIAHSRSPEIHQAFAKQTGIAIIYRRLEAPVGADDSGFAEVVRAFSADGGVGMNVTAPFKEAAFRLASEVSERSRLAEASNTLMADGHGGWCADNTDGIGLVRDLTGRLGLSLTGRRVLILGAGGASAGILGPLLDSRPSQVVVWNRSVDKARGLIGRFASVYPDAPLSAFSDVHADSEMFDLVIHATSLKTRASKASDMSAAWPWLTSLCTPDTFFYDLDYADNEETFFLKGVKMCGACRWSDGLGMLVEQAAESFRIWHGVLPETLPVFSALRPEK
ncbi:MAG: shikimate dehydrogenase [Burkholderiales bacterium]|jgi:shikimate dehydrogenase|nr:shikimate dehydrogenase [Burkholderiales bacterium]